jgi:hypothetical protein
MYRCSPTLSVRSKIRSLHPGISFMMLEKKKEKKQTITRQKKLNARDMYRHLESVLEAECLR